jgi:hypothetical protein
MKASNAASIGQVHKATLNDKTLAIKIQYPGVGDSIKNFFRESSKTNIGKGLHKTLEYFKLTYLTNNNLINKNLEILTKINTTTNNLYIIKKNNKEFARNLTRIHMFS